MPFFVPSIKLRAFFSSFPPLHLLLKFSSIPSHSVHSKKTLSFFCQNVSSSPNKLHTLGPARQLFDEIPHRVSSPPNLSIPIIISAIRSSSSPSTPLRIHAAIIKTGLLSELPIATSLITFYSSICDVQSAKKLFCLTPHKNLILWTSLITALSRNGRHAESINTFSAMKSHHISPNCVSLLTVLMACANAGALISGKQIHGFAVTKGYHSETSLQNSLVDMYAKCGKLNDAMLVFDRIGDKDRISWKNIVLGLAEYGQLRRAILLFSNMRASDVQADEFIVRNMISICSQMGESEFGAAVHCYSSKSGLLSSTPLVTSLLIMYADCRRVEAAEALFSELDYKDHVAWTAMVSVYAHSKHPNHALEVYKQMRLWNKDANEITLVSLLQSCSLLEARKLGRSIHGHALRIGYGHNMFINSALIDFYCRTGRLREGEAVFYKLQSKDLVCWSSMIKGYGAHGCGREAIETFDMLLQDGLMPNEVVLVSVLSACSHCSLLDEGWKLFQAMEERFGIVPNLAHYSCMVDLLGRGGGVKKAFELIETIPFEPDVSLWAALLSWCTTEDIKIAEAVVKKLMRLDVKDTSYFVTLTNLYSKLGMWEDAERIRGLMELKGLKKVAGYSMV